MATDDFEKYAFKISPRWMAIIWVLHIVAFVIGVNAVGSLIGGLVGILMLWSIAGSYWFLYFVWVMHLSDRSKK